MAYNIGTAAEVLENVFEVIEGGKAVEAAKVSELVADNGAKIFDIATKEVFAANGSAAEVSEVVSIAEGATTGTTAGAGILAMDVGVAGALAAPVLGIAAGVGLYNLAPEFWTEASNKLVEIGSTVKNKVVGLLMPDGSTTLPKSVIDVFKDLFLEYGLYSPNLQYQTQTLENISLEFATPFKPFPAEKIVGKSINGLVNYERDAGYISRVDEGIVSYVQTWQNGVMIVFASDSVKTFDIYDPIRGTTTQDSTDITRTYDNKTVYLTYLRPNKPQTPDFLSEFLSAPSYSLFQQYEQEMGIQIPTPIALLAWALYFGSTISPTGNLQPGATYPELNVDINISYPDWLPWEFPETLPVPLPDCYPVSIPTPDITQDPAQTGDNPLPEQLDKIIELLFNRLPENAPDITPDPDPSLEPEPEPQPEPDPDPNPPDPNPPVPTPPATIPIPTLTTTRADRMFTVYNPTDANVNSLGAFLWTSSIIEQIKKLWDDPMQAIISFHKIYGSPSVGSSKNIILGYIDSGVSAPVVTSQFCDVDCGSVTVPELLNNATSYSPFTSLHIYLPFIGIMELDTNECMKATLHVKYRIDVYTGTCVALIYVSRSPDLTNEQVLYTFSGNASQQLPLTSSSFGGAISALLGLAGAGVAVASGGALGVAAGALGAAHSLTQEMVHINRSGGLSANAGILGSRKPYLILSRQYGYDANGYAGFYGYPSNKTVYIGNCNGYIKCKDVIFRGSCTQAEAEEIERLLKNGVYV